MSYIALKRCRFRGVTFEQGAVIESEYVDRDAVGRLKRVGIIGDIPATEEIKPTAAGSERFNIPVYTENGEISLSLTNEDLITVFKVLQKPLKEVEPLVEAINNLDVLTAIHALESRKSAKALVEEKAATLQAGEGE